MEGDNKQTPPPAPTLETIIPEEFRSKPYLNDLKALPAGPEGYNALFKKLDGAQTLIGKKTGIPEAGAPPEEWEKFHAMLRPSNADEYEIAQAEGQDPEMVKAVKGMFHEAGLSKAQASKLLAKFGAMTSEKLGAQAAEQKRLDEEFEAMTKAAFGAENVAVLNKSKELLEKLTPDNLKPHLPSLDNKALVLLAGVMQEVRSRFMKEDPSSPPPGNAPMDATALREEGRKLMASKEYMDPFNPKHEEAKKRVSEIYAKIGSIGK